MVPRSGASANLAVSCAGPSRTISHSWAAKTMADPDDDRLAMDLLLRGFQVSRTIRLVADLGIADRIAPEAVSSVVELASASGVLPEPLLRAIRALAAFGVFRVDADG